MSSWPAWRAPTTDANVLCLGERVLGQGLALDITKTFLATNFEGGRHLRRIDQFDKSGQFDLTTKP